MIDELPKLHEHGGETVGVVPVGVQDTADYSGTGQCPSSYAAGPGRFSTCNSGLDRI